MKSKKKYYNKNCFSTKKKYPIKKDKLYWIITDRFIRCILHIIQRKKPCYCCKHFSHLNDAGMCSLTAQGVGDLQTCSVWAINKKFVKIIEKEK